MYKLCYVTTFSDSVAKQIDDRIPTVYHFDLKCKSHNFNVVFLWGALINHKKHCSYSKTNIRYLFLHFYYNSIVNLDLGRCVPPRELLLLLYVVFEATEISRRLRGPWGRQHQSKYSMLCMTTPILVLSHSPLKKKKKAI